MPKLLTDLELKVMKVLWEEKKAFVKDLLENWNEAPKPAYNTVSTIVRILEEKGFIDHKAYGRSHQYFPKITKAKYQKMAVNSMVDTLFAGSMSSLVTALTEQKPVTKDELKEMKELISKMEKEKK